MTRDDHPNVSDQLYANYAIGQDDGGHNMGKILEDAGIVDDGIWWNIPEFYVYIYIYIYNYVYNTVMTFKYVKAGPDREAAEVVWNTSSIRIFKWLGPLRIFKCQYSGIR